MPSSFPGAIDSFTDPLSTSPLSSPSHALQHQNINDAVEKIETYMGLVKVVPTVSGTGVTVSATGTVTFSGSSNISVINAFSALYQNYKICVDIDSANNEATRLIKMRWRTASGDDSTAVYHYASQMGGLGNTALNQSNAGYNATEIITTSYAGQASIVSGFVIDVMTPQISTKKTKCTGTVYGSTAGEVTTGNLFSATIGNATYTGFSVYPSAGSITGTITVYGYRN